MVDFSTILMLIIFTLSIAFMLWRPKGINETIPVTIGAAMIVVLGFVSIQDLKNILSIVSGPSLTILSTIMMSIVLESIGFFKWIAQNIIIKSNNSGIRLYVYINLLCFFMTMLFNNDGSILITTPIIIHIIRFLSLKPHQYTPYLISGALIATASSAPIAVSNISNLIALKIVGLDLNGYVKIMFIPSMIGIFTMSLLLYFLFRKSIPKQLGLISIHDKPSNIFTHPLDPSADTDIDHHLFKICIAVVVITRGAFFALSPFGIPLELIGLIGAFVLIAIRWFKRRMGIKDVVMNSPWHILLFAFSMYVLVYGLKNLGLNTLIITTFKEIIEQGAFNATIIMGILTTVLSNIFNNLPAVMIGTLAITEMGLNPALLQVAYLANVIGSDIGSLLTPIGTLATLIWMFILKKHNIRMTWGKYISITILIIPVALTVSLLSLYLWVLLVLL